MELPIIVRYRWTLEQFLRSYHWNARRNARRPYRVAFLALFVLVLLAGGIVYGAHERQWAFTLTVGAFFLVWFGSVFGSRWMLRYQFSQRRDQNREIEWIFTPEQVMVVTELGRTEVTWESFIEVTETSQGFLLFQLPQLFHWLPRDGFMGDADVRAFAELAKMKVSKYRRVR